MTQQTIPRKYFSGGTNAGEYFNTSSSITTYINTPAQLPPGVVDQLQAMPHFNIETLQSPTSSPAKPKKEPKPEDFEDEKLVWHEKHGRGVVKRKSELYGSVIVYVVFESAVGKAEQGFPENRLRELTIIHPLTEEDHKTIEQLSKTINKYRLYLRGSEFDRFSQIRKAINNQILPSEEQLEDFWKAVGLAKKRMNRHGQGLEYINRREWAIILRLVAFDRNWNNLASISDRMFKAFAKKAFDLEGKIKAEVKSGHEEWLRQKAKDKAYITDAAMERMMKNMYEDFDTLEQMAQKLGFVKALEGEKLEDALVVQMWDDAMMEKEEEKRRKSEEAAQQARKDIVTGIHALLKEGIVPFGSWVRIYRSDLYALKKLARITWTEARELAGLPEYLWSDGSSRSEVGLQDLKIKVRILYYEGVDLGVENMAKNYRPILYSAVGGKLGEKTKWVEFVKDVTKSEEEIEEPGVDIIFPSFTEVTEEFIEEKYQFILKKREINKIAKEVSQFLKDSIDSEKIFSAKGWDSRLNDLLDKMDQDWDMQLFSRVVNKAVGFLRRLESNYNHSYHGLVGKLLKENEELFLYFYNQIGHIDDLEKKGEVWQAKDKVGEFLA